MTEEEKPTETESEQPATDEQPEPSEPEKEPAEPEGPEPLFCLGGQPPPADLGPALMCILRLPELVRERFSEILLPHLEQQPENQLDERITTVCRQLDLPVEVAGVAIKASRMIFRQAAAYDLDGEKLTHDILAVGGDAKVAELLLPLYDKVSPMLRKEIYDSALAAHGNVLSAVEWRIDSVGTTSVGRSVNLPVVFLTLQYLTGGETKRITLQAQPEMVEYLRNICGGLLQQQ